MEKCISWEEVVKTHKVISGISTKGGLVHSLLCNTGNDQKYPNKIENDEIIYYVGQDTPSHGINALFKSMEQGNSLSVFQKIQVNKWRNIGHFCIKSVNEESDGFVSFKLIRVGS